MTFKVGDKIRGILDTRMKLAKVIELFELNGVEYKVMKIKIIEHTDKTKIGRVYIAYNLDTYFELVEKKEMNKLEELEKQVELYEKNIESQQQSLETLKRELEQLKAEKDKENEVWEPEVGDLCRYVDNDGYIYEFLWNDFLENKRRYAIGNVFHTKEEAEFRVEQLKVEAELRRFSRPFHVGEDNYTLYFSNYLNSICMVCYSDVQYGNIYFASKEIAQKAIDTVGEDRIKKYYFGVKE